MASATASPAPTTTSSAGRSPAPRPATAWRCGSGAATRTSDPFTYTVKSTTGNPVLLMPAEDYTGKTSDVGTDPYPGPLYQDDYQAALDAAGISYDVYDVDANGRTAASALGVLSHYKAVIWETGEDTYVREPGAARRHGHLEAPRRRDPRHPRLPQRRRQGARGGQVRAAGRLGPVPVQPARRSAGAVLQEQPGRSQRQRRPGGPALQLRGRVQRLPAVLARRLPADRGGRRHRQRPRRCRSRRRARPSAARHSRSTARTPRQIRTTSTRS